MAPHMSSRSDVPTLAEVARGLKSAADAYELAGRAQAVLYVAIRDAVAAGMSESEAARLSRISRPTVRKIMGKS